MQYLKEEQEYIDRYDLHTIEECLDIIKMFQNIYDKSLISEEFKDMSKRDKYSDATKLMYWHLWIMQAQKYKNKKETIRKWMEDDRIKQEKYDSAPTPRNIHCSACKSAMQVTETKHLEDYTDQPMRVMFIFRCTNCKKQEWVYDDGEIRVSKPDLCPKCNNELDVSGSRKGKVITTFYACKCCKYSKKDILDLNKSDAEHKKWEDEQKKKEEENKKLLEKYRAAFCLSEEEGEKYLFELEAMEFAKQVHEEAKQKYDNSAYQQVSKLKKLTIVEIEKLLTEVLEKEKYIKFSIAAPEIGQFIFAPFTLQDADSSRRGNISTSTLEKLIKSILENTNWRLVDGVSYRLGFLSGRLKGYEREDDLIKLYEKEKEREGFFLNADGYYNCGICYEGHYGNKIWWNLDGIRCANCWKNIKDGVIPPLKEHLFDNEGEWFSKSQLKDTFNIHPASVKKMRGEGLFHGRDLKNEQGGIYYTVYLESENQEFLKKYPRKKKEVSRSINTLDISGHAMQIGEVPDEIKNENSR